LVFLRCRCDLTECATTKIRRRICVEENAWIVARYTFDARIMTREHPSHARIAFYREQFATKLRREPDRVTTSPHLGRNYYRRALA
jgi:hypothetical protein